MDGGDLNKVPVPKMQFMDELGSACGAQLHNLGHLLMSVGTIHPARLKDWI